MGYTEMQTLTHWMEAPRMSSKDIDYISEVVLEYIQELTGERPASISWAMKITYSKEMDNEQQD